MLIYRATTPRGRHRPPLPPANPTLACPTCKRADALTLLEAVKGYQCRACTRRDEGC